MPCDIAATRILTAILCTLPFSLSAQPGFHHKNSSTSLPNGISSGDTTAHSTVLWSRRQKPGMVEFTVRKRGERWPVYRSSVSVTNPSIPAKVTVDGLESGQHYRYSVSGVSGPRLYGTFTTAAAPEDRDNGLHFAVTGDWRGELAPYPAIKNVTRNKLDFFIKLGDTIYADYPSPAVPLNQAETLDDFRAKHEEVYSRHLGLSSFARIQQKTSVFAMIDDHEVSDDFAGGAAAVSDPRFPEQQGLINQTVLYRNGLQAFNEYNAIADKRYPSVGDDRTDQRPDLYRSQQYGSIASVFILDARSFRDAALPGITDLSDPAQTGEFIAASFDASQPEPRTMLGRRQLKRLQQDLLSAQLEGVTWKFIAIPEPIQNLGVFAASDRFEGYASERSELLQFIDENAIHNVVFIAADIHGTLINDLSYQRREDVITALIERGNPLLAPQIPTTAFEITTGSVAFSPVFGDAVTGLLAQVSGGQAILEQMFAALGVSDQKTFQALPAEVKNVGMESLLNQQLQSLGYTPIGLDDNPGIQATLVQGQNTAVFSFGWTHFDIQAHSHQLTITTYGIEPYTEKDLRHDRTDILARQPKIVSQISVAPE